MVSETLSMLIPGTIDRGLKGKRRPVLVGLFALGLAGALTGCGQKESAPPPQPPSLPPVAVPMRNDSAGPAKTPKPKNTTAAKPDQPVYPPGTLLIKQGEPNFVVQSPETREDLQRLVVTPETGLDSTFVSVVNESPVVDSKGRAKELPPGFEAIAEAGLDDSGNPRRIRCQADGSIMVLIPAGLAIQGIDGADPNAAPKHAIEVDLFYIDQFEITVEQYNQYRTSVQSSTKLSPPAPSNSAFPRQPAAGISWRDAMQYGKWTGKELPTESQWEKAARGTHGYIYPWGEGRPIWELPREPGKLTDVGLYRTDESPFGVRDMAGNAREWCQDWFAPDAYLKGGAGDGVAVKNSTGPRSADKKNQRVIKGGSTGYELWHRTGASMSESLPDVGFRMVLRPFQTPPAPGVSPVRPGGNVRSPGAASGF